MADIGWSRDPLPTWRRRRGAALVALVVGALCIPAVAGVATAAPRPASVRAAAVPGGSLFPAGVPTSPPAVATGDTSPIELGVKFRSDVGGQVTGLRFWKGATNTGTHVGHLWTAGGNLLATVTFSNETASGWQLASFPSPVTIAAGAVYVVSYFAPRGSYAYTRNYFTAEVRNATMHGLADGASGHNGAYMTGASGGFPRYGIKSSNYWVDVTFAPAGTPPPPPPACAALGPPVTTGSLGDTSLRESSGLAVGVRSPGVLYSHNDSGDTARLFAMATGGRPLGRFALSGATAVDWEDLGIGPGPVAGRSYLYVGDIGGANFAVTPRRSVTVYRVAEPLVATGPATTATTTLTDVTRFDLAYPGGASFDSESMLVDPVGGDVHIVTKDFSGVSQVFRFHPGVTGGSSTLVHEATVTFPGPGMRDATGGSVSPDGSVVAIRTEDRVFRWARPAGSTIAAALSAPPCVDELTSHIPGESVAFGAGGRSLWVTSEGSRTAIGSYSVG